MEQFRQQNAQETSLNRILRAENTLLESLKRKELEKNRKRKDNIIKDVKNRFRLKKKKYMTTQLKV